VIRIDVLGTAEVQSALRDLAANQLPFAISTAINNTAFKIQAFQKNRLPSVFDRPTPLVQGAMRVEKATKETLTGRVFVEPKRGLAIDPHERGGDRGLKKIERELRSKGWMPSGYRAVPSREMELDSYGNPVRTEVNRIIKWIQSATSTSGQRTATQRYICIPVGSSARLFPGIWLQSTRSSGAGAGGYQMRLTIPLFLFVRGVQYKQRLDFQGTAKAEADRLLPDEIRAAVRRAVETAR